MASRARPATNPGPSLPDEVQLRVEADIATVTLNRPGRRNAMNIAMLDGLRACFDELDGRGDVRAVIIRGEGPAFCSGMDLREMRQRQQEEADPESGVTQALQRIERARPATIAMVHGDALAGGCELALHCDLRVAAEGARFGMPLARIGLVVPFALGQKLVEIIGPSHTRQLLLTGRPVDARRAREMGMVHEVVAPEGLEAATYGLARTIADNAPLAVAGIKATIARAIAHRAPISHDDLDDLVRRARRSADAREGMAAILEKRKPVFRGE